LLPKKRKTRRKWWGARKRRKEKSIKCPLSRRGCLPQ
jgi:hypothetical protein